MSDTVPRVNPPAQTSASSKEVRFAVVMYGGVSLAIYIHGVTQELLRMVRATARKGAQDQGLPLVGWDAPEMETGTGRVYRKLSHALGGIAGAADAKRLDDAGPVRFVVDILSGTSAGGINGVFLAKALAHNQDLEFIKRLWLEEADISHLINDKESTSGVAGLDPQRPPQSLLNSQRMYRKLLDALERMGPDEPLSHCAAELDLYVTTTDIRGVTLPLRLADRVAYERRHRQVFHFLYAAAQASGEARNDFGSGNNPFLAFAARCTSSFPVAFEPMRLQDIAIAPPYNGDEAMFERDRDRWSPFFNLHPDPANRATQALELRAYGDGGYLDNKPFSYATDTLLRRRADSPVDRKLIYIEPDPQHPERCRDALAAPTALENAAAALLTIPGYETIREDIERILQRNRTIERVARVTVRLDADVTAFQNAHPTQPLTNAQWARSDLDAMIVRKGIAYGAYHRLKIGGQVDDVADLLTRVAGFDADSDQFRAIRYLVRAWRDTEFIESNADRRNSSDRRPTQNKLLMTYDLGYRLRRIHFIRGKIDAFYELDEPTCATVSRLAGTSVSTMASGPREAFETGWQASLLTMKRGLNDGFVALRLAGRRLRQVDGNNPLADAVAELDISATDLVKLLNLPTETERQQRAMEMYRDPVLHKKFRRLARRLARVLKAAQISAAGVCTRLLKPSGGDSPEELARKCLWHYYEHYDDYDMVLFPIQYGTDVGETAPAEIIRISPEDATSIIDENYDAQGCPNDAKGRRKLAGIAVGHFGAFLEHLWRQNDMLWGRLDGAERIIAALLPAKAQAPLRTQLIKEAHLAILAEELETKGTQEICRLITEVIMQRQSGTATEQDLRDYLETLRHAPVPPQLQAILLKCLNTSELLTYFRDTYQVNRRLSPAPLLRNVARATVVVGQMLDDLADRYRVTRKPAALLIRAGRLLWGLVEFAAPRSVCELLGRYWINLLYLAELITITGGWLLSSPQAVHVGEIALAATVVLHAGVLVLGRWIRRRTP